MTNKTFKEEEKGIDYSKDNIYDAIGRPDLKPRIEQVYENDDPESTYGISEKDYEDMFVSQGKNEIEKMERRFNIWLKNRDDDFEIDIWQFRCLQDFIFLERKLSLNLYKQKILEALPKGVDPLMYRFDDPLRFSQEVRNMCLSEVKQIIENI